MVAALIFTISTAFAAENEPNDSISQAKELKFENGRAVVNANIANLNDKDFYKITLNRAGKIEVGMTNIEKTQFRVTLINSFNKELEVYETKSAPNQGVETLFFQGLDKGTYYIKVEHFKGDSTNAPYTLKVNYTATDLVEKEDNNDRNKANPILLNTTYAGWADPTSDFYSFKLAANSEVKVNITQSPKTKFEVSLLNANGNPIETWETSYASGTTTIIHTGLPEGTYYLKILTKEGDLNNIPYNFTVNFRADANFETELNNTPSTANEMYLGQFAKGVLSTNHDVDYYRLYINGQTNVDVYMTQSSSTTFKLEITDSLGKVRKDYYSTKGNGSVGKVGNLDLVQGFYTIKVSHDQGNNNKVPYTLRLADSYISIEKFKDYEAGAYWVPAFEWGIQNKVIKGDPVTNRLNPNQNITEAQWLAMLLRYALPHEAKDSPNGNWYDTYYQIAVREKIEVSKKPNEPLRRGLVAKMLAKVYTGQNMSEEEAVDWMYKNKITTGTNVSKPQDYLNFNPAGNLTRAQAITFMHRLKREGIEPRLGKY